ncbi:class I SAM-dependent methyltransferase [Microbispora sp. RL4-1S]|uniref:S-adenosyl-L-methionine-dependent methyltransferase n=1 Tax=Microbispora oryzae TaxID=2806554 RepID=A0A941AHK1_9ACTN|nr:SAM-dependent methyltransferase [Microbispora oryzae]MBP2704185.1 class I SAM-dependent methyltransferase [Microbispora oryzae]
MNSNGEPSQTALTAAAARAAHLIVDDEPLIFRDTLAYELLGDAAETLVHYHRANGAHPVLASARAAVVTRARYTEDRLEEGVGRGVGQYVILGAGLDSFALRSPLAQRVQIFEVDHPATQEWKRARFDKAGIAIPPTLTFVPADFESRSPADALVAAGFDPTRPALVAWLGVVMYLTRDAVDGTLAMIAGFAPGTEIVLDYMLPEELRDARGQSYVEQVMPFAAERGEAWLSFFGPEEMASLLGAHGFEVIEHAGQRESVDQSLWRRPDALAPSRLSVLTHARLTAR